MIEKIREIKIDEINKKLEKYYEQEKSYKTLNEKKLKQIREKIEKLKLGLTQIVPSKKFTFIQRLITKRKEYKDYKYLITNLPKIPNMIEELKNKYDEEVRRIENDLFKLRILFKKDDLLAKIQKITNVKTIYELGLEPVQAMEFLELRGITPILTEADKEVYEHKRDYTSRDSLIGVHKTNFRPSADMIKSAKDAHARFKDKIVIKGKKYQYFYKTARETVHMAMNDEVSSHIIGALDDCKYAILIPFKDLSKIAVAAPMDTFTYGNINLTKNSWILCPKEEASKIKALNMHVNVIGYEGENVTGYAKPFFTQLGYRGEDVLMHNWKDKQSNEQFSLLMNKCGYEVKAHVNTPYYEAEKEQTIVNHCVELSKTIKRNNLIRNLNDIKEVSDELVKQNCYLEYVLFSSGTNKKVERLNMFFKEMKKNGIPISSVYANLLKKLDKNFYKLNDKHKEEIFEIPEHANIAELESILDLKEYIYNNSNETSGESLRKGLTKFLIEGVGEAILKTKDEYIR